MKKTLVIIFSFLVLTSFVGISVGNLLPTEKQSVEKMFDENRIDVEITNHGGFGADIIGISKLTIKRKNDGTEYRIKYNDKLDGKKFDFIVSAVEYDELKSVFFDLVKVHDKSKTLNGDCIIIDKNYELKSDGMKMIIKPSKNSSELYALDGWIYKNKRE
jgi:hypothetical protein